MMMKKEMIGNQKAGVPKIILGTEEMITEDQKA